MAKRSGGDEEGRESAEKGRRREGKKGLREETSGREYEAEAPRVRARRGRVVNTASLNRKVGVVRELDKSSRESWLRAREGFL